MNTKPKIYVIIPVYNNEMFVKQCVNSILNQPYKNINAIIVDDGSKDNSPQICDQLANENNRVHIIHQKNQGVSKARNTGLSFAVDKCSDNDYIGFCDSDDFWVDGCLTDEIVSSFTDCDLACFRAYRCNYSGTRFSLSEELDREEKLALNLGTTDWIGSPHFAAQMYKAKIFKNFNIRFPEETAYNEDVIFSKEFLFCCTSMFKFDRYLYVYRKNKNSATNNHKTDLNNALDISKSWNTAISFFNEISFTDDLVKKWENFCIETLCGRLIESAMELAIGGFDENQINDIINNNEMSDYLDTLNVAALAKWQQDDFILFRNDISLFVAKHKQTGKKRRLRSCILNIPIIGYFSNLKKYPMTRISP